MKTAIQQYIERLEEMLQVATEKGKYWKDKGGPWQSHYNTTVNTLRNTITEAQQYLEIDRQIIEKVYDDGCQQGELSQYCLPDFDSATDYYNQTFNNQTTTDENSDTAGD